MSVLKLALPNSLSTVMSGIESSEDLIMKPGREYYAAILFVVLVGAVVSLLGWWRGPPHNEMWKSLIVCLVVWVAWIVYVGGHQISVQNGVFSLRNIYGFTIRIPVASVVEVTLKEECPEYALYRKNFTVRYRGESAKERVISVNPRFYTWDQQRRLLGILGYQGKTHVGRV